MARSIFLQGFCLTKHIMERIKHADDLTLFLRNLDEIAIKYKYNLVVAVAYVAGLPMIDYFIVGTSSGRNLKNF